jgi:hypothetical protein
MLDKQILLVLLDEINLEIEKRKKDKYDFKSEDHFKVAIGLIIAFNIVKNKLKGE